VEEELKAQRELMQQGFAGVEKRLEQSSRWMAMIAVLVTRVGSMGAWGIFAG